MQRLARIVDPEWMTEGKTLVYQATVVQRGAQDETYIGLSAPTFKTRIGNHRKSFRNQQYEMETTLFYFDIFQNHNIQIVITEYRNKWLQAQHINFNHET